MGSPVKRDKQGRFLSAEKVDYLTALTDQLAESAMVAMITAHPTWTYSVIADEAYALASKMIRTRENYL